MLLPSRAIFFRFFLFAFFLFMVNALSGQKHIIYTNSFTEELKTCNLAIEIPTERWYRIVPNPNDDYWPYDLVLQSTEQDQDIRFILHPSAALSGDFIPHIEACKYLITAASNIADHDMKISALSQGKLDTLNAQWGILATFVAKEQITHLPHASFISIYHKDYGWVNQFFYFKQEKDANPFIFGFKQVQ